MSDSQPYSVVSLFSGCGGIDLGFKGGFKYGDKIFPPLPFEVAWANDWDQWAVHVYNHNHSTNFQAEDITRLDFGDIPRSGRDVDVVTAGFPCQDFSLSGPRNGTKSMRGKLYLEVRRALRCLAPKLVIAENVPGIEYPPSMFESIVRELSGYDEPRYKMSIHRINCADYGVPQVRHRIVIVGIRSDLVPEFTAPEPVHQAPPGGDSSIDAPNWMKQVFKGCTGNEGALPPLDKRQGSDR